MKIFNSLQKRMQNEKFFSPINFNQFCYKLKAIRKKTAERLVHTISCQLVQNALIGNKFCEVM